MDYHQYCRTCESRDRCADVLVSNPDLVIAQCTSGLSGFPALNAREEEGAADSSSTLHYTHQGGCDRHESGASGTSGQHRSRPPDHASFE